jgi:hypothetical protein
MDEQPWIPAPPESGPTRPSYWTPARESGPTRPSYSAPTRPSYWTPAESGLTQPSYWTPAPAGKSFAEIRMVVNAGGRLVVYQYCISVVFLSFKDPPPYA